MQIDDILRKMPEEEHELIEKAYGYAKMWYEGIKRRNGDMLIDHTVNVASILADLNVDGVTIASALLHDVLDYTDISIEEVEKNFGNEIAVIVKSISKLNSLSMTDDSDSASLYLRQVMVGLCEDVRVLFIKLADRLHNMKTMDNFSKDHQKKVANETLTVLVPIAHRLGINSIKSELENLCLYYQKPKVYNDILEKLNSTMASTQENLEAMKESISNLLTQAEIKFRIKGRVKSVYSIYNKLNHGKAWEDIYDILALRVFVDKESDCYAVIGAIHSKYRPVPGRFKDYIAVPKENMYQSLHTTVFGENGFYYEIQVRTYEMDEIAEKGIASHWSYKEKGVRRVQSMMEQKLELYRNIIESANDTSLNDFTSMVDSNILTESIYVYTPKGDVMELPKGSTPIDFAYRIHSKVGDAMVGAIVNNQMVPIDTPLQDNDIVKIMTSPTGKPRKDWLNMAKTASAKNKIKAYFSKIDHDEYVAKGKSILEKDLRKRKIAINDYLTDENINKICKGLHLKDLDDIYLSIGSFRYTSNFLINYIFTPEEPEDALIIKKEEKKFASNSKADILVDGKDSILTHLAKCCNPVKGDKIIGVITRGDGIAIHRDTCENVPSEKTVEVSWNEGMDSYYIANLIIIFSNEKSGLNDIMSVLTSDNINIASLDNQKDGVYHLAVKVKDAEELGKLMNHMMRLRYVKDVKRA